MRHLRRSAALNKVVNLRRARKSKARDERRRQAAETAASAGESAAEAGRRLAEKALLDRRHEGRRLDRETEAE